MKREDFKIEGIPEGYRVYDVDLTPSGVPVAVLGHAHDTDAPLFTALGDRRLSLPRNALWTDANGALHPAFKARCISDERFLFAQRWGYQAEGGEPLNVWVWNKDGTLDRRFYIGEGFVEVLAGEWGILAVYDESAIFGDEGPHKEGVALFDLRGELRAGFRAGLGISDGFAGCWAADGTAFAYYFDPGWMIARIDVTSGDWAKWRAPHGLGFARAVSVVGDRAYLGAFPPMRAGGQGKLQKWLRRLANVEETLQVLPSQVVEWCLDANDWSVVGEFDSLELAALRGLPGGRFIAVQPDGYTILSFD